MNDPACVAFKNDLPAIAPFGKYAVNTMTANTTPFMLNKVPEVTLFFEISPFVTAINRLLTRVAASVDRQRRFVADAPHELRSPMTALFAG
jgi:signal transduction histidine kinase